MKPVISVVIPAYNEEDYIETCLKSLRNQKTSVPYEIIVCDNNSTDRTVEIAKKYADKVVHEERQGIGYARNKGVSASVGEYIVNTDADTVFAPNFIDEVYKVFIEDKYVAFACGNWDYYKGDSKLVKLLVRLSSSIFQLYEKIVVLKNTASLPGWSLCTPRWVFDKVGGFDTRRGVLEDVIYSYKVEAFGKKGYFPEIEVHSSVRRFVSNFFKSIKHYDKMGYSIKNVVWDLIRKSKSPYNGFMGFDIKKRYAYPFIATVLLVVKAIL